MGHAQIYEKDTAAERRREALIRAVGQGDRDAFYRLYQDTARSLYSYILSLTGNPQEAEDVTGGQIPGCHPASGPGSSG